PFESGSDALARLDLRRPLAFNEGVEIIFGEQAMSSDATATDDDRANAALRDVLLKQAQTAAAVFGRLPCRAELRHGALPSRCTYRSCPCRRRWAAKTRRRNSANYSARPAAYA